MCPKYTNAPPPSPTPGHDRGALQHRVEGLRLGKKPTKFQLSSIKGTQFTTSKRNET